MGGYNGARYRKLMENKDYGNGSGGVYWTRASGPGDK